MTSPPNPCLAVTLFLIKMFDEDSLTIKDANIDYESTFECIDRITSSSPNTWQPSTCQRYQNINHLGRHDNSTLDILWSEWLIKLEQSKTSKNNKIPQVFKSSMNIKNDCLGLNIKLRLDVVMLRFCGLLNQHTRQPNPTYF